MANSNPSFDEVVASYKILLQPDALSEFSRDKLVAAGEARAPYITNLSGEWELQWDDSDNVATMFKVSGRGAAFLLPTPRPCSRAHARACLHCV